jgi:hypothetical protein
MVRLENADTLMYRSEPAYATEIEIDFDDRLDFIRQDGIVSLIYSFFFFFFKL